MVPHDAWVFYSRHNLTYTTINGERYEEHWVFSHQLGELGKRFTISRQNRRHELGNVMPRSSNISQDFRAAYCCGQEDAFLFCSTGLWYAQKSWDHSHTRKKIHGNLDSHSFVYLEVFQKCKRMPESRSPHRALFHDAARISFNSREIDGSKSTFSHDNVSRHTSRIRHAASSHFLSLPLSGHNNIERFTERS